MTELVLGSSLEDLVLRCETECVAGCCGLDAFNFHPIYVARHLMGADTETLAQIEADLDALELAALDTPPSDREFPFTSQRMNACFSEEGLFRWTENLRKVLREAVRLNLVAESRDGFE